MERFVTEAPKSTLRTDFERDRARILHSSALRRLGEKTQVMGPASDDYVRTRLTHSLEVAQVGRHLAKALGADPDVVDAACLSHDLGHPPFGHNGEKVLNELSGDCGGFEGNAQTLRVLTRLEPKVMDENGHARGLNLTRSTLDAACKYPWLKGLGTDSVGVEYSTKKYSVYDDDAPVFEWLRDGAPEGQKCLEAQIMDLSDDIAYSVHDVEDGIALGKIQPSALTDPAVIDACIETTLWWYKPRMTADDLLAAFQRLTAHPAWNFTYDGRWASLAALKDLTSDLIGRFCEATVQATRSEYGDDALGRYRAQLIIPFETRTEITMLKGIAAHLVMAPRETEPMYFQQRTLLADLVDTLWESRGKELDPLFAHLWKEAEDESQRLRVVIDQVASLTDASASKLHSRLCGMLSTQL